MEYEKNRTNITKIVGKKTNIDINPSILISTINLKGL